MILRLTEGSLSPVECLDDNGAICDREENCVTQILWKKLDDAIKGVVRSYNPGRPDELAIREGGRVYHIKSCVSSFFFIPFFNQHFTKLRFYILPSIPIITPVLKQ